MDPSHDCAPCCGLDSAHSEPATGPGSYGRAAMMMTYRQEDVPFLEISPDCSRPPHPQSPSPMMKMVTGVGLCSPSSHKAMASGTHSGSHTYHYRLMRAITIWKDKTNMSLWAETESLVKHAAPCSFREHQILLWSYVEQSRKLISN